MDCSAGMQKPRGDALHGLGATDHKDRLSRDPCSGSRDITSVQAATRAGGDPHPSTKRAPQGLQLLMAAALWLSQEPPSSEISSPNKQLCCPKGPLRGDGSGQRAPAPGHSARSSLKIFSAISRVRPGSRGPALAPRSSRAAAWAPATAAPAKRPRDGAEAGGPGGHPGAPAGGSRGKKGSLRAGPGLFTHGRARLNGRCVLCTEPGPSGRARLGAGAAPGAAAPQAGCEGSAGLWQRSPRILC